MNVRVMDEAKRELAMGRDLAELRKRLGEAASLTLAKAKPSVERENITSWDFGELPAQVTFKRGNQTLTGYPALTLSPTLSQGRGRISPSPLGEGRGEGSSLFIRLFDTRDKADEAHREGVKRLLAMELKDPLRALERGLPGFNALALKFNAVMPAEKLREDLTGAIVDRAFLGEDAPPRDRKAFDEQKKRAKARLPAVTEGAVRYADAIADAARELGQALAQSSALGRVAHEVKAQRDRLVYPGFFARTPWDRLEHVPRYLRGYALRLRKYRSNPERDARHAASVQALWDDYEARAAADREADRRNPKLEEFRWLIEELRISLFAQELRTPFPVSAKRLAKFRDEHLR